MSLQHATNASRSHTVADEEKRYIQGDSDKFRFLTNQTAYGFDHSLVRHPLFELDRLAQLVETVLAAESHSYVLCKVAESIPNISRQWDNFSATERVAEAIANIETSGSWVMIGGAQIDPDYQALLDRLVDELQEKVDPKLRDKISWIDAFVFIGSPNSVTHIHIDSETNFLFQIHGTKEAHLFDRYDRSIVDEPDLERFFSGDQNVVNFKPEFENQAKVFDFTPGKGIHIPVNAPHWVKNLSDYSITFSVLFYTRDFDRRARIYQANRLLRKCGLRPTAPGNAPMADAIKAGVLGLLSPRTPSSKEEVIRGGLQRLKGLAAPLRRVKT